MGTHYIFKVSPINDLGQQLNSPTSNKCTTSPPIISLSTTSSIFYGSGITIEKAFTTNHKTISESRSVTSRIIKINDMTQIVSMYEGTASMTAWKSHWSPQSFEVIAESVWADPPLADKPLLNADIIRNRIVWIRRGGIGLAFKAQRVYAAGAVGIIFVDDGQCATFSQKCVPGADKSRNEGFAALDVPGIWENINIPTLFVLWKDSLDFSSSIDFKIPEEARGDEL